jgi:hypothetical protein
MLAAMSHQLADHIPLWFNIHVRRSEFLHWDDPVERAEKLLDMGVDDTIVVSAPRSIDPRVSTKTWVDHPADSRYPLIHKVWSTPAGALSHTVQRTDDWDQVWGSQGEDVGILGDENVPRSIEFPLKGAEDLDKLDYLFCPPTADQLAAFRERVRRARDLDRRRGVLIEGGWLALGDMFLWLLGTGRTILIHQDQPELTEQFLERFMAWARREMEILLDAGVDVITYRAWYEPPDFWGVRSWRRFIKPRLQQLVDEAHAAGARFSYILTTGLVARAQDLQEVGIDTLWGVDPVQDLTADLPRLKREIGAKVCLLGGVNSTVTLVNGTEEEIRAEVRYACETLGPGGGFILSPIDNIYEYTPKRNIEVLIDEWRRVR